MDQELLALLALKRIPGIGNYLIRQLISYLGSAAAAFHSGKAALASIPGIGSVHAEALLAGRSRAWMEAENEEKLCRDSGCRLLHLLHPDYPSRLKKIPDAPAVLYLKGRFNFENPRVLAVVGTRQASAYGKEAISDFLSELSIFRPVVVSGLAYGIDIQAHRSALNLGLESWAVMGTGMHMIYPSAHKSQAMAMQENGGLISEVPLNAKTEPGRFPERNRIIAGLSDAVWVVEAMETGGALITARLAADYFRDVFALPGNYHQPASMGCNRLIAQNQAALVYSGKQLAEAMGWDEAEKGKEAEIKALPADLSSEEAVVWSLLEPDEQHLDELAWKSGIPVNRLAGILLNLEFNGLVKPLPGKKFSRKRA